MKIAQEFRQGDTTQRAGIVITCGNLLLCGQPTNMIKNGWKLDIFKGHLQKGEIPVKGAIRECYEESNILFETWKLSSPIQTVYKGNSLFLFHARLKEIVPTDLLSCISTFIDSDGIRKPEIEDYQWVNPFTELYLIQEELRTGVMYYFNKLKEDCQIAGSILGNVPPNINKVLSLRYKPNNEEELSDFT